MAAAVLLHVLSVVIWIGGMFFAWMVLRPAAADELEGPDRLRLWNRVLATFFMWVWLCVTAILLTGYWMIFAVRLVVWAGQDCIFISCRVVAF